jgi:hypothetical protein
MQRTVKARDRKRINTNWKWRRSSSPAAGSYDKALALKAESYGELVSGRVYNQLFSTSGWRAARGVLVNITACG